MGQASYLMAGMGNISFLQSASHGAGRAIFRGKIFKMHEQGQDIGLECANCVTLKEERLIEEAPYAYKNIEEVIDIQVKHNMVKPVARLKPILTFKG
jgi:tRNA-splicing ligase RtcB